MPITLAIFYVQLHYTIYLYDKEYYLLEHEEHGDQAIGLIVDKNGKLIMEEIYNSFDDLTEALDN